MTGSDATGQLPDPHEGYVARDAWRRAVVYFAACLVLAIATGTVAAVLRDTGADRQGNWWMLALAAATVVLVGYGLLWPRGTFTEDRPSRPALQAGFGATWGLCQGLLFVMLFRLVDSLGWSTFVTAFVAWAVISVFQGTWHQFYWDVRVSPPHNIPSWNPIKVGVAHVPNITLGVTLLAVYGDLRFFVLLQVVALTLSSLAMRFPPPDYARPHRVGAGQAGPRIA